MICKKIEPTRIRRDKDKDPGSTGGDGERNTKRNGQRIIEFCNMNDIKIGNTYCKDLKDDKYTYVSAGRRCKISAIRGRNETPNEKTNG